MTQQLKGLVLAGGKGTRLRPLTYSIAKQLVPVANHPILLYPMNHLVEAGITDIGVIISPETGEHVQSVLNDWQPEGVKLTYILQQEPAGLAHAVKIAEGFLADSPFVMYLGDNLVQDKLAPMIAAFENNQADAQILLKSVENPQSFGVAVVDDMGKVTQLIEKPKNPPSDLALVGVYLFRPIIFKAIHSIQPSPRGELEITDAIQYLTQNGYRVEASEMKGWWLDTGKKDDLLAANRIVLDDYAQSKNDGLLENTSIVGAVEIEAGSVIRNATLTGPLRIGKNCVIENAKIGPHTSIGNNCTVRALEISNSVVLKDSILSGLNAHLTHSLIGQGCKIAFEHFQQPPDHNSEHGKKPEYQLMLGDENVWTSC